VSPFPGVGKGGGLYKNYIPVPSLDTAHKIWSFCHNIWAYLRGVPQNLVLLGLLLISYEHVDSKKSSILPNLVAEGQTV